MNYRLLGLLGAAALALWPAAALWPAPALAQANRSPHYYNPQLSPDEQIMPSQIVQPPPAPAKPKPKPVAVKPPTDDKPDDDPDAKAPPKAPAPPKPAQPVHAIACSAGAFAKRSDHLKLAQAYGVHNVDFTDVPGDDGSTLMASVVFPNDPKRRLEVLWDDDTQREGTRMIVIEGQSTWQAQKGVRLGLTLAALEKLNGKPFKIMGFDKGHGMAMVSDWNGGALGVLTDGCKIGVQFKPDPKATSDAVSAASGDKEFASTDPAIRAAKPTVGEIIVAY